MVQSVFNNVKIMLTYRVINKTLKMRVFKCYCIVPKPGH